MSKPTTIRDEIKQTRPFRSLRQEAVVNLLRTADMLRRSYEELAGREGITAQQYNVLRILRGAGGRLPTMEIGERLLEHAPGITRLLDRLEEKGLVSRLRCEKDRRRVHCDITQGGLDLLARLDAPTDALDERNIAALSDSELKALSGMLDRVRAGLPECIEARARTN